MYEHVMYVCMYEGEKSVVTGSKDSELKIKKALRKKQKVAAY